MGRFILDNLSILLTFLGVILVSFFPLREGNRLNRKGRIALAVLSIGGIISFSQLYINYKREISFDKKQEEEKKKNDSLENQRFATSVAKLDTITKEMEIINDELMASVYTDSLNNNDRTQNDRILKQSLSKSINDLKTLTDNIELLTSPLEPMKLSVVFELNASPFLKYYNKSLDEMTKDTNGKWISIGPKTGSQLIEFISRINFTIIFRIGAQSPEPDCFSVRFFSPQNRGYGKINDSTLTVKFICELYEPTLATDEILTTEDMKNSCFEFQYSSTPSQRITDGNEQLAMYQLNSNIKVKNAAMHFNVGDETKTKTLLMDINKMHTTYRDKYIMDKRYSIKSNYYLVSECQIVPGDLSFEIK